MDVKSAFLDANIPLRQNKGERAVIRIDFIDSKGSEDQTELDVEIVNGIIDLRDLESLYNCFCKENYYDTDTVFGIEFVETY